MHKPVLVSEVLEFLDPQNGEFFIDATAGAGGHTKAILEKLGKDGKIIAIEWNKHSADLLKSNLENTNNLEIICGNYADIPEIISEKKISQVDGLLADLGFSSDELENSGRGFSFKKDEPLLMTYSDNSIPVYEILRKISEIELADIIRNFSNEKYAKRIAHAIKEEIKRNPHLSSLELAEVIKKSVPGNYEMRRINPATRTFQALRIYANKELKNLEKLLLSLPKILQSGGRAVFISFHSLEDKLVKNYFRKYAKEKIAKILTKKPVTVGSDELGQNIRSRSAKLRAIMFF
ncbi:MAG: 16S rRNA (cytosine(1402)-N(4))-methyltransferase [Candidatus Liptonbacteria bacterium RIFOXYC1_FULL_36_8]|uniref:Ribosomal RNA small subunit methyltransferase H n=3 Tax=Candidatus Liptoniibacteriota TaxID=1817909 RepID=A0A1G2CL14_9BACT|nr:MAG: 16S rRNA (cytosine(1402)-N(4))-methyltransferase [Candidatus Liptonbacteria bacterium RIFOXYB1_FULL_36_10]OGZ03921.1 MAG: 16S rRNA (cytosine(1402)-N(4))-methyltransferase [Candidatus Liptonbacteria bacterium RIFOXYD1_FULL_36_11]OGZ04339.1 MAG: 16S rRNA (cytosine(1402)-N(4))-methyltransferase [Candidatus Liptonbacteria bacterium RIFOXYC1_FULL_36_8]